MQHAQVTRRELEDTLVASMRFRGQREDIAPRFEQIRAAVGTRAAGPRIVIVHGLNPETGYDLEVCVPVSETIEANDITCRVLPGGPWLSITHIGAYQDASATWGMLSAYINERCVGIAEDPARQVYREGSETHGEDTSQYVTKLQVPLLLPRWIADLAEGLDRLVGPEAHASVLADDQIDFDADPARQVAWAQSLMQRVDAPVTDEAIRARIMNGCAHRFPVERIDFMRQIFRQMARKSCLFPAGLAIRKSFS